MELFKERADFEELGLRTAGIRTARPTFNNLFVLEKTSDSWDDKTTVFKIVDTMLTKKKFKDFFAKNVAML